MTNGTASSMTNGTVSNSKMTNGTVTAQDGGSSLTLQYKDGASEGSQTITIPPGIPVVAIEPGQSSDLQPGTWQPLGAVSGNPYGQTLFTDPEPATHSHGFYRILPSL